MLKPSQYSVEKEKTCGEYTVTTIEKWSSDEERERVLH
ncbi:hypothetical protein FHT86_000979 [Rhizobium sp. BK313]|nr:hypothetical protein [Rhizobium sp. BK313]